MRNTKYKFDPKYENKPVKKIGLKQWAKDNPSPAYLEWQHKEQPADILLNKTQVDHLEGKINVYENIETYTEKWYHKGNKYYPIEGTKVSDELPPIYIQWKDEYRKKHVRKKRK
tara:strand:+ start:157 stop:498 length:342 start_codon:yes stop_codon:yes gene_type:complete